MTTHAERSALYAVLQEVLGSRPADTLMAMIPQSEHLATKSDLEVTTADLRSEMREIRRELKADMADLRVDLRSQTRTFVVTQTATVFGVAGLVVAIQQLL